MAASVSGWVPVSGDALRGAQRTAWWCYESQEPGVLHICRMCACAGVRPQGAPLHPGWVTGGSYEFCGELCREAFNDWQKRVEATA